jgi:transcription elongation factor Elf1
MPIHTTDSANPASTSTAAVVVRDTDGRAYVVREAFTCARCNAAEPADPAHHYGLPRAWEPIDGRTYRGAVVCGACVAQALADVLDALRVLDRRQSTATPNGGAL